MTFCARRYTFCLLIVRLDQKQEHIKSTDFPTCIHGTKAISAVYVCIYRFNIAGYLQRVQIKLFIVEIFTKKKHLIHRNPVLQQLTWISFVTDIKQTCLGQGLGVTITARKRQSKLMLNMKDFGHTLPGHLLVCQN